MPRFARAHPLFRGMDGLGTQVMVRVDAPRLRRRAVAWEMLLRVRRVLLTGMSGTGSRASSAHWPLAGSKRSTPTTDGPSPCRIDVRGGGRRSARGFGRAAGSQNQQPLRQESGAGDRKLTFSALFRVLCALSSRVSTERPITSRVCSALFGCLGGARARFVVLCLHDVSGHRLVAMAGCVRGGDAKGCDATISGPLECGN